MQFILHGGTDAGDMVLFDPGALPDDFDKKGKFQLEDIQRLAREGRIYWLHTNADGDYHIGLYLADALPETVQPYAKHLESVDELYLPTGELFFTGIEYAFHSDDSELRKYPGMGQAAQLPPGRYRMEVFEFDYPTDFEEDLLRERIPGSEFRAREWMNTLAPLGCIPLLFVLGVLARAIQQMQWSFWMAIALVCGLVLIAVPVIWSRRPAYRNAIVAYAQIEKDFPGYGVLLQRTGPPTLEA
jgi:hypothetical protein